MTTLFSKLVTAGLVANINGDDTRLQKLEAAANSLAHALASDGQGLMRAVLAGLDPEVSADDPALQRAERALTEQWKAMRTVHTDTPVHLERAVLLEACAQAAERDGGGAIVWLAAADALPFMALGREEDVVSEWVKEVGGRLERRVVHQTIASNEADVPSISPVKLPKSPSAPSPYTTNREQLRLRVGATAGPHDPQGTPFPDPNPYWPNNAQHWAGEFAKRMHILLAEELDAVASADFEGQQRLAQQLDTSQRSFAAAMSTALTAQQAWTRNIVAQAEARRSIDQTRLDALWWSEAMYSPSLRCG